ncbi:bifunctional transcriptional activator/DNA repair enzyme AdaA [Lysobacter soli]|uniref:methylated-DNA--[protein]-cysteine S-methyltransferase n=1 Tax=Lysobacter soli TaxID=453783 RepID=A0A3D8VBG5_9GAMM|nr:methylated-DNA--[protein]-cysteine S-methyltransferase [Lysobacter soli]RDY66790.1 methylated-DNA--[protein]-cysteine S-methyltransferase [Lysobacter soli]
MTLQTLSFDIERDPRWLALCARDRAADGRFIYSVKTTGVYCRPSCAARRPLPRNVDFHATPDDAERAGFRACRRCHPRRDNVRQTIRFAIGDSSLGLVLVAQGDAGLRAVLFGDDADVLVRDLQSRLPGAALAVDTGGVQAVLEAVVDCIEAPHLGFGVPVDLQGTPFQVKVWQALRRIPEGSTVSYGELARRLGMPDSARAVAAACAANPLAVVVPCHRVVAADGGLSGYRWGVARKRALLQREAHA